MSLQIKIVPKETNKDCYGIYYIHDGVPKCKFYGHNETAIVTLDDTKTLQIHTAKAGDVFTVSCNNYRRINYNAKAR